MGEDRPVCAGRDRVRRGKPAFVEDYGEAREGNNMNPKEQEQSKPKGVTRREFLKKAGVAALSTAAGLVLPDSLKNTRADAPVEPVYTKRVFVPRVLKDISGLTLSEAEKPLWPDKIGEFGPYNVEIVNRGITAGVETMDQELLDNLIRRMREWAIAPEVPRRVIVYEDYVQLSKKSEIPRADPPTWDSGTSLLGPYEWRTAELPDGTLQLDIHVPKVKDPSRLDAWQLYSGVAITEKILNFLFADREGNYQDRDRFNLFYRRDWEIPIYKRNENNNIISAPLYVKSIN